MRNISEEKRQAFEKGVLKFFIVFFAVITIIFIAVFLQYSKLESGIKTYVSVYGLIAIFIIAFFVDLLMQPIGPEVPLIAGIISGINPILVVIFTSLGSALASITGYWLGKRYGYAGFTRMYPIKTYKKWRRRYIKNGNLVLAIAALSPVPYVPVCWLSGMFDMKKTHFFFFGIMTRISRIIAVAYLTVLFSV